MTDFTQMLADAGIPATEEEMQARWNEINTEQGSRITNNSQWSPFWRLISAIVTEPCQWLVGLMVDTALPNAFLKTASGAWLDILAWAVDVSRKEATRAAGQIVFERVTSAGEVTIPAGTIVESPSINGYVYRLVATADVAIPDGQLTAAVPVEAEAAGAAYNLGPGYYSILPQPLSGIGAAANAEDWISSPGADEESDEELRLRCRNQFSAVGQYHHDAAYTAAISSFAGIRTDYIWFEHDAPRGPGSANCYIMIDSGAPAQEFVDQVNAYIRDEGNHGHGDDMLCYPMPETPVALSAIVYPAGNLAEEKREALRQAAEDMIRSAFRENSDFEVSRTWPFSRFSLSRLAQELHGRLPDLASVVFDREDIVTAMELPALDALAVALGAS